MICYDKFLLYVKHDDLLTFDSDVDFCAGGSPDPVGGGADVDPAVLPRHVLQLHGEGLLATLARRKWAGLNNGKHQQKEEEMKKYNLRK